MNKFLPFGLFISQILVACGGSPLPAGTAADLQNPPTTGSSAVESWLTAGVYKQWKCEVSAHDARSPSPHGKNRICSNAKLSAHGSGEYPVDAAAVKELYDDSGTNIIGVAVYRKVKAGSTGDAWYWYERAKGVVADGTGSSGPAKDICVGCHQGAGSDAQHSGHDFVYTQVK